ncbi:aldehyde dehydrogenase family protein [Xylophilus sp. GW821-FHT01B05]
MKLKMRTQTMPRLLINGELLEGQRSSEVVNPATGAAFATVSIASEAQLDQAVQSASDAAPRWARTEWAHRASVLSSLAVCIRDNGEELAQLITLEQGKPLAGSRRELQFAAAAFESVARLRLEPQPYERQANRSITGFRSPLGVVGAIATWNYPLMTMASKISVALMAGNTVVLKPSPNTPIATLRFGELVRHLLPAGVLNIITDANDLGALLVRHPKIDLVSFTGSTKVGRQIAREAGNDVKHLVLELGGNDAAIVLSDSHPTQIADSIFRAAFQNAGQTCLAIKRLYVHERIYAQLTNELVLRAQAAVVGDGMDARTQIGPVQNQGQYARAQAIIDAARQEGVVAAGGETHGPGYFVRPTIVTNIADGSQLVDDEQFCPVLPIIRFSDEEDALERANASSLGLGGSVWSPDVERAGALARRLEVGTAWVNNHMDISLNAPVGGVKQSGYGVEFGGAESLAQFTRETVLHLPSA